MNFPKQLCFFQSLRIMCPEQEEDSFSTLLNFPLQCGLGAVPTDGSTVIIIHSTLLELKGI